MRQYFEEMSHKKPCANSGFCIFQKVILMLQDSSWHSNQSGNNRGEEYPRRVVLCYSFEYLTKKHESVSAFTK